MSIGNFIDSLESRVYTARGIIRGRIEEKEANLKMAYELGRVIGADQIREKRAAAAPVINVQASPELLAYLSSADGHPDDAPVVCIHCGYSGHSYSYANDYSIADLSAAYAAGEGGMTSDEAAKRYLWGQENDICPDCYMPLDLDAVPAFDPHSNDDPDLEDPDTEIEDYQAGDVYSDPDDDLEDDDDLGLTPIYTVDDCVINIFHSYGGWKVEIYLEGQTYDCWEVFETLEEAEAWAPFEAQAVIDNL